MVTLQLRQLDVPLGQALLLRDVSWSEFEAILEELGQARGKRVAYDKGLLEIMAPLPEHEYFKATIGDAVKDIAEELNYVRVEASPIFPSLDIQALPQVIEMHRDQGRLALRRAVRAWVKVQGS